MYFLMAFWYVMSGMGLTSIAIFFILLVNIFEEEIINRSVGYKNYFIIVGVYALLAVPLAATINGGTGRDFLFVLGCLCPGLCVFIRRMTEGYEVQRAQTLAAQLPVIPPPAPKPLTPVPQQPSYVPAPATLATDFDVPPQR